MGYSKSTNCLNVRKLYRDANIHFNDHDIPIMILDSKINEIYPMTLRISEIMSTDLKIQNSFVLVDEYLNEISRVTDPDKETIDMSSVSLLTMFLPITLNFDREKSTLSFEMGDNFELFIPECLGDCNAYDYD